MVISIDSYRLTQLLCQLLNVLEAIGIDPENRQRIISEVRILAEEEP